jgi:hypothetical protein
MGSRSSLAAWVAAVVVALSLIQVRAARAEAAPPAAVVPSPPLPLPTPEPLPDRMVPRLFEKTALVLDGGELAIGFLAFRYGITDRLSVGIDPPYWAVRAFAHVLIPNLNLKVAVVRTRNLWVSGNIGAYYAFTGKNSDASGQVLLVPLSGFASIRLVPKFWIHPELTYTVANAFGAGNMAGFTLDGTAATRTLQLGLQLQYELMSWFSLTLWGRYEPYTGAIAVSGSGSIDQFTTATIDARVTAPTQHPFAIVPGVAFLWRHWRITAGVGYGNYFLPGMDLTLRGAGFVPDASVFFIL